MAKKKPAKKSTIAVVEEQTMLTGLDESGAEILPETSDKFSEEDDSNDSAEAESIPPFLQVGEDPEMAKKKATRKTLSSTQLAAGVRRSATNKKSGPTGEKINKAAEIRAEWDKQGLTARPKDIVAALEKRGITVAAAQVSNSRKSLSGGTGKAAKPRKAAVSAGESNGYLSAASTFVKAAGGLDKAIQILEDVKAMTVPF